MQAIDRRPLSLKVLVGSGHKIALVTLPFASAGVVLNVAFPSVFDVGGPPELGRVISWISLLFGVTIWLWSVALILSRVPRGQLITTGPFAWVKHPLYTSVALVVLPWLGVLLNSWLGVVLGIVMYLATRRYGPEEEADLARTFGESWEAYRQSVKIPWL
jgi:protein-S-isoprenylcysteine O-methyltransferase Ste14